MFSALWRGFSYLELNCKFSLGSSFIISDFLNIILSITNANQACLYLPYFTGQGSPADQHEWIKGGVALSCKYKENHREECDWSAEYCTIITVPGRYGVV